VPKYSGNAGLTLSLPKDIFISPYLNAVGVYYDSTSKSGRLKFGPYQTVNVNVRKAFVTTSSGTFNLTVDLYNVLNQKYEMPWQFQNPGFSMFVGLEARF
jgi:outer membrane receptor protein involved in Fe transport